MSTRILSKGVGVKFYHNNCARNVKVVTEHEKGQKSIASTARDKKIHTKTFLKTFYIIKLLVNSKVKYARKFLRGRP